MRELMLIAVVVMAGFGTCCGVTRLIEFNQRHALEKLWGELDKSAFEKQEIAWSFELASYGQ